MGKSKAYDVAGVHFTTQGALEIAVKEYLQTVPLDTPFKSRFLREIVNTLHEGVIAAGQRSTGDFEYLTWGEQSRRRLPYADMYRGGKVMMTLFEPLGQWSDVTVYPWRKAKDKVPHVLRVKSVGFLPKPTGYDTCAFPGCGHKGMGLHYHHVSPTFAEMVQVCRPMFSESDRTALFGYTKFMPGVFDVADCVPDDHPAILRLKELHVDNVWNWLCEEHHTESHSKEAA